MGLGIVIAYKADNGLRTRHAKWTVARYKKILPDADIVLSEDPNVDNKDWFGFCKGKWINRGVERVRGDMLLVTDIDIVLPIENIVGAIEEAKTKAFVTPYNVLYKLSFKESARLLDKEPMCKVPSIVTDRTHKVVLREMHPQGVCMLTRKNFELAGGYDERFVGWGSEDSAFHKAVMTMCDGGMLQFDGVAYHFKHPIVKNRQKLRDQNVGVFLEEYRQAYGDKEKMIKLIEERY